MGMQMEKKRNSLYGFTEAHFICEDGIPVFVPVFDEPIKALKLKILKHSMVFIDGYIFASILLGRFRGA